MSQTQRAAKASVMEASEIIQILMRRNNMNLAELARRSGIGATTIGSVLRGDNKEPRDTTIEPIAKVFNVSKAQLRGYAPIAGISQEITQDKPLDFPLLNANDIPKWLNNQINETAPVQYYRSGFPRTKRTFVYELQDDAMAGDIPKGGHVYIDPDSDFRSIADHHELLALIEVNGRYSIRREIDDMGRYVFKANNETYRTLDQDECTVVGYVIGMPEQNFTSQDLVDRLNKR